MGMSAFGELCLCARLLWTRVDWSRWHRILCLICAMSFWTSIIAHVLIGDTFSNGWEIARLVFNLVGLVWFCYVAVGRTCDNRIN